MMHGHRHLVRVRFPDVDWMGWAHHSVYLVWFEIGRTEMLRAGGFSYSNLVHRGLHFPVVEIHARYRKPVGYDTVIAVDTRLTGATACQLRFEYTVRSPETATVFTEGMSRHAVVNPKGQLLRLPADVLKPLRSLVLESIPYRKRNILPNDPE